MREEVRRTREELKTLEEDINISIDVENIQDDVKKARTAAQQELNRNPLHVDVDVNLKGATAHMDTFIAAQSKRSIDIDVDLKTGGATLHAAIGRLTGVLEGITRGGGAAAASMANLAQGAETAGGTVIRAAQGIQAVGFLALLAGLAASAATLLSVWRPLMGALPVLGSAGAAAAAGGGLLAASIIRLVQAAQDGDKYTKGLRTEWQALTKQFTGSNSVFDQAAKSLAPVGTQILSLANKAMPALGKEATEVAKSVQSAFKRIEDSMKVSGRQSEKDSLFGINLKDINPTMQALNRLLDTASKAMGNLTAAAGKAGAAIINILGSRGVINAAKDLFEWIEKVAGGFLKWSQSEKGIQTINNLVKDAKNFVQDLGKAFDPILDALGDLDSQDVARLGSMLEGIGDAIGAVIKAGDKLGDVLDKFAPAFKAIGTVIAAANKVLWDFAGAIADFIKRAISFLNGNEKAWQGWGKGFNKVLTDASKALGKFLAAIGKWVTSAVKSIAKFHSDTIKAFGKWVSSVAKSIATWAKNTLKSFATWASNTQKAFAKWFTGVTKGFTTWVNDTAKAIAKWVTETEKKIGDWISGRLKAFQDFVADVKKDLVDGFTETMDAVLDVLDQALGPIDEWVADVIDTLGQIFDFLGEGGTSGDKNPKDAKNNPRQTSGGSPVGARSEGGVYDTSNVRYMDEGGFVDRMGTYTAETTGMDEWLSRGAMWHPSGQGGIADGSAPRVVYGEGRPGQGPKKEAYIPEDMPSDRAMDVLAEVGKWFGAQVGFGSNRPHAHFLPESERQSVGAGTWVMHGGGIMERRPRFMAPIDQEGNAAPNASPEGSGDSNNTANTGGYTLGIAPPNSILNTFMEYIPGYPYGNEHHLGVDVVPGGNRDIHAPAAFTVTSTYDRSSYGEGQFIEYNVMTPGGDTYAAFAGHTTGGAPSSGKPDQVMSTIGPYSGWGGGPDHLHLQTAPHPAPVGMDPGSLIDPFSWWGAVGGTTSIPSGSDSSAGFDYFGAAMKMLGQITTPEIGLGSYGDDVENAMFDAAMGAARAWIRQHVPFMTDDDATSRSSTGSGDPPGSLAGWAKQGLEYGKQIEASPENVQKITTLAMQESGGDPSAVNTSSGASGLMQMLVATFDAYRVASGDDIFNPVDNVAASSRYQLDRYGGLVTFSPYTRGGIATRPQIASVAEHGPEFFMPLHDPESSRRFMSFLENAAAEREKHGSLPWQTHLDSPGHAPHRGGGGDAVAKEIRELRRELREQGMKIEEASQRGIGDAAAGGTISRLPTTSQGREAVRRASISPSSGRGTTGGRVSP